MLPVWADYKQQDSLHADRKQGQVWPPTSLAESPAWPSDLQLQSAAGSWMQPSSSLYDST
jgi:hypothetical protein